MGQHTIGSEFSKQTDIGDGTSWHGAQDAPKRTARPPNAIRLWIAASPVDNRRTPTRPHPNLPASCAQPRRTRHVGVPRLVIGGTWASHTPS